LSTHDSGVSSTVEGESCGDNWPSCSSSITFRPKSLTGANTCRARANYNPCVHHSSHEIHSSKRSPRCNDEWKIATSSPKLSVAIVERRRGSRRSRAPTSSRILPRSEAVCIARM
jgi:hypothetical protein